MRSLHAETIALHRKQAFDDSECSDMSLFISRTFLHTQRRSYQVYLRTKRVSVFSSYGKNSSVALKTADISYETN